MSPQMLNPGGLPSPIDYRDKIVASAVAAAAPTITLPPTFKSTLAPKMNQRQIPACVSHSAVDVLKLWYFAKHGVWVNFSPRFLDIMAKRYDGQDRATGGTWPRLVFWILYNFGCATEATLPNDTTLPVLQYRADAVLTPAVMAEAAKYKIPGYIGVSDELFSTRQAIYLYGAISSLFSIGNELWVPSWSPVDTDPLRTPKLIISGHQMTPFGWDSDTLNHLSNEWGPDWASGGNTRYDPKAWAQFTWEQWAIAAIPSDTAAFLKALPSPAEFHYHWDKDMKVGDENEDVKFLQVAYMILGYLKPIKPEEFGYFGQKTAMANLAFQVANKISPTAQNNAGTKTRTALNKRFSVAT